MTEGAIVVRGNPVEPAAHPAMANAIAGVTGQLPEVLQLCNAIAGAGELIPSAYRGKPGAVLLAKMWADKHSVDLFTAIQNIDVIDGKPWVKTQMRVELAVGRGFEFRVTETTTEVCTVEVWQHRHQSGNPITPKQVGEPITARFDHRPRKLKYKSGKATPWALHPDDMLFAEACRKADRRYVRTAADMIDTEQDYVDDTPDVVATLTASQNNADSAPVEVVDVDEAPAAEEPAGRQDDQGRANPVDGDELRAVIAVQGKGNRAISELKALKAVRAQFPDKSLANADDVAADPQALDWVLRWVERGGKAAE